MWSKTPVYVAGFDRGVRPIGDWSMLMILSIWLRPSTPSWAPGRSFAWCRRLATEWWSVSLTSVDLPEPETPVTQQKTPSGTATSIPFRLCSRAFRTSRAPRGSRRSAGTSIRRFPERYWPVSEAAVAATSAGGPSAMTWPPCSPAPGPRSTMWSAAQHRPLVVLDDDHGVAEVAEPVEGRDQLRVVALVEADRGLVEHVHHADQARADLGREPDPLRLAAGERPRRAREREVADADVLEEGEPFGDLAHDQPRDRALGLGQLERADPLSGRRRREGAVLGDAEPADLDREALGAQPGAAAVGAGLLRHVALDPLAVGLRVGLFVAALELVDDPLEPDLVGAAAAEPVRVGHLMALAAGAVEEDLPLGLLQLRPRRRRCRPRSRRRRRRSAAASTR